MGELLQRRSWAGNALGPPEHWPRRLQGYVAMILQIPTPMVIFWGPELNQIYNDGYTVIMGPRHPRYLGEPYRDCWPDTYPILYPWMQRVLGQGEMLQVKNEHFMLTRYGFEEEAYFTFSFSPLLGDDGRIAGVMQPVLEVTEEVLSERRAATLRALSGPRPSSDREVAAHAARILVANAKDIPFVIVFQENPGHARLGVAAYADLDDAPNPDRWWDVVERVQVTGASVRVDDVELRLGQPHPGVWGSHTRSALAVPLRRFDSDTVTGVAILGVSPRLRLDDRYRQFLESAARQIAVTLTTGRDARARSEMREREQRMREQLEEQLRRSKVLSAELSATNEQLATRMSELARAKENLEQALREGEALQASLTRTNQELDQFAYVASHDLKAPLRGIASLVSWIEEDLGERLTDESREYMQQLHGRVRRLGALIDGILQYARAGRTREGIDTVDSAALLAEVAELLSPAPPAAIVVEPSMPTLRTERVPLQQVFMNLISNALKYARREDARVVVSWADDGAHVRFSIADNGPGISADDQTRIWGIFQTLSTNDRKSDGTGIGLAVVKKLVESRGGRIWVESTPGQGATFHFTWLKQGDASNA